MQVNINRLHKDRLFKDIFASPESKGNALQLYNALNSTDYKDENDLEVYTISDAIYMRMKNDFSFILNGDLNLYEQQSTFNLNMPLRGLFYFSKQYERFVGGNSQMIYSTRLKKLPTPKYVVFYNGGDERPEREVLKLSDAFENQNYGDEEYVPSLEVRALALNINYGHNKALPDACRQNC